MQNVDRLWDGVTTYTPPLIHRSYLGALKFPLTILGLLSPVKPIKLNLKACVRNIDKKKVFVVALKICYFMTISMNQSQTSLYYSSESYVRKSKKSIQTPVQALVSDNSAILKQDIETLKAHIVFFDEFIQSKPDLLKMCLQQLKETPPQKFQPSEDVLQELDPTNVVDLMTLYSIERRTLCFQLNERLIFIKKYPEIWELFKKHVSEEVYTKFLG